MKHIELHTKGDWPTSKAAFPNRKSELLRHKCFIIYCHNYYEKVSQQLKHEVYQKNFKS